MNIEKAILILRKHNDWRRHKGKLTKDLEMQSPIEIGVALDTVLDELEDRL